MLMLMLMSLRFLLLRGPRWLDVSLTAVSGEALLSLAASEGRRRKNDRGPEGIQEHQQQQLEFLSMRGITTSRATLISLLRCRHFASIADPPSSLPQ